MSRVSLGNSMEFKVVVLGDRGVGKTSLVLRFIEGFFSSTQQSTVGAFFLTKKVVLEDGVAIRMQLWDTAGQERYRAMAPMYYRNANAAVVCYDVGDESSFSKMKDWIDELKKNVPEDKIVLIIAANKIDRPDVERLVSRNRGEAFAQQCGALYFETSAKNDFCVKELFQSASQRVYDIKMATGEAVAAGGASSGHVLDGGSAAVMKQKGVCC